MTEFQAALKRFLSGELDFPGLEATLLRTLQSDPASAASSLQALDHLYRSSRLPAQLYISLKQNIPASATPTAPGGPAAPPPAAGAFDAAAQAGQSGNEQAHAPTVPGAAPGHAEAPQEPAAEDESSAAKQPAASAPADGQSSGILDILQSGNPEQAVPATPEPNESPTGAAEATSDPEPPADEKTVFRQAAPSSTGTGQHSAPITGTGSYTGTGAHTGGGMSMPPGFTGTGTGTGSNWTDPSRWGAGPAPTMQPGSILKDRYVLEVVIGRGGMGVVFKAKDLRREEAQDRNPFVAVKILNDEFRRHPESLKALQRESRKAQDLAHPNIVTVFDFDRDGPIVYMTMEYLEGQSLDKVSRRATFDGMPMSEAFPMIDGLGLALAYAHGKGIVHSDFKPANVFLTEHGEVKVFDFGIARAAKISGDKSGEETLFDPGSLGALTPAYASCEMLDGEEPDARDDIYALACVTYELLTGTHPFGRRSAAEARDKKIPLPPIKSITRRQWRGIQKGLAFRRGDRSANVDAFLNDIRPRTINKTSAALATAAVVALVGIGIVFVPNYLEDRRISNMIVLLGEATPADMPAAIEQLGQMEPLEQDTVRGNSAVRNQLVDFYTGQIVAAQNELEYPLAESLAQTALAMYPDSNGLISTVDNLASAKADLLSDLLNRFNAHLQAGSLLPDAGEDITDVFSAYEKIDPGNETLSDPRLAIAYANAAEQALASDVQLADRYLTEWQQRFPDDPSYPGLRDRVNTIRDVQNREIRVAELQQQLTQQLAALASPEDALAVESDLLQLEALAPTNALVANFRRRAQELTSSRITELLNENDWVAAERQLSAMQQLVSGEFRGAESARIGEAQAAFSGRIDGMFAAVMTAVQNGEFAEAEDGLAQLGADGRAATAFREARAAVSRAYLDRARAERAANNFEDASGLIEAGQQADPGFTNWLAELSAIDNARGAFESDAAEESVRQAESERLASIATLTGEIEASLAQPVFGIDAASRTLNTIDELGRLDPSGVLSTTGRSEVAAKLASLATARGFEDGQWDAALTAVTEAIELLPGESILRQARDRLQAERGRASVAAEAQQVDDLKADLERLLAAPDYGDNDWEAKLRSNVQSLVPIAGAAEFLATKRSAVAQAYLGQAESLLAENRFNLAEQRLDSADWFMPEFAPARSVRQRLAAAVAEFEAENRDRQRVAEINGLKRTFETDLNAERIPDAKSALTALGSLLPSGDGFLTSEAPQRIADTYLRMAQRAVTDSRFDTAEQLAQQGLREVPDHSPLKSLLANIVTTRLADTVLELENIIASADPGDPAGPRGLLAQVRQDAGSGFQEIDTKLRALATQRISGARTDRDSIAKWVSGIFDNFAAPDPVGAACTSNMAAVGKRARGQCYDYLPDMTTRGPRLVVIPAGNGIAGTYAITRQEISVGQWNDYCRISGNCTVNTNEDEQIPITNIELRQALEYASWLTANTNYTYRLPTDAEWVHAATADGSAGVSPNCVNPQAGTGDRLLEVNRGGQNAWGVMNYIGNAQEWVNSASGDVVARGGGFRDRLGSCVIETSRPHSGAADEMTGIRLVRDGIEG